MRSVIIGMGLILFSAVQAFACSCECTGDCTFRSISNSSEFVALVKVISHDDYLEGEIIGHVGQMPYSMTVEIIKKYKGKESRRAIKIWGDNGAECRPYIAGFKIGEYYLIAPNLLGQYRLEGEESTDYDFFSCLVDYLKVDMKSKKAYGNFTSAKTEIGLTEFEGKLKM